MKKFLLSLGVVFAFSAPNAMADAYDQCFKIGSTFATISTCITNIQNMPVVVIPGIPVTVPTLSCDAQLHNGNTWTVCQIATSVSPN